MNWIAIVGALLFFAGILASIALHEIGHLVPAKLFGVRVTQYMVGFGKTVWSKVRGETEYGIKLIPLGGYVRMVGMFPPAKDGTLRRSSTGPFQTLIEQARRAEAEEHLPGEDGRHFYRLKPWKKVIVMSGGPMMNLLIAFVLFGIVLVGFGTYQATLTVANVSDCVIDASEGRDECRVEGQLAEGEVADPIAPAAAAGVQMGDELVAFNGTRVESWDELTGLIRSAGPGPATLTVRRDGTEIDLYPDLLASERPRVDGGEGYETVGFLGVGPDVEREQQSALAVFPEMGNYMSLTVQAMGRIPDRMVGVAQAAFGGERALDSPMSVVGASRVAGDIASRPDPVADRIAMFIQWLAAVNLFIALFNFIPLLPLDGGHIAGAIWEAIKRRTARLLGRPDPGYVDVAKALPVAYAIASVLIVMGVLLIYADVVNPVRIPG